MVIPTKHFSGPARSNNRLSRTSFRLHRRWWLMVYEGINKLILMKKNEPTHSIAEAAAELLGKILELQGRPACQNKACGIFLIHSPTQLRKYGVRNNKSTGKAIQRFECLACHQKFTAESVDIFSPKLKNTHIFKKIRHELDEIISYEELGKRHQVSGKTIYEMMEPLLKKLDGNMMASQLFFDGEITFLEIPITTNKKYKATVFIGFRGAEIEIIFATEDTKKNREKFIAHYLQKFIVLGKELKIHSPYTYKGTFPFHMGGPDEDKENGPFSRWIDQYTERILLLDPEAFDSIQEKTDKLNTAVKKIRDKNENKLSKVSIDDLKKSIPIPGHILKDIREQKNLSAELMAKILETIHIPKKHLDEIHKIMPLEPEVINEIEKNLVRFPHLIKSFKQPKPWALAPYEYFLSACHKLKFLKWTKAKNIQELRDRLLLFSLVYNNRNRKMKKEVGLKIRAKTGR